MNPQAHLWEWPQRLANAWWELAFHPSAYIHPDQVVHRLGAHWPWQAGPVSSRTVARQLNLTPVGLVDWSTPQLRAALLPLEVLKDWSLLLAATHEAPALARVIRQSDLQALQPALGLDDWAWAIAWRESAGAEPDWATAGQPLPVSNWAERLHQQALRLLGQWMAQLPESLSQRLALKWPPGALPRAASTDRGMSPPHAVWRATYERVVNRWDPTWESDWSLALALRS